MPHEITVRRKIEFGETDMAGIVHFTNYFRYVEVAEAALFEATGHSLIRSHEDYHEGWPRVRASSQFQAPLYFGDQIEILLRVTALKIKAIEYQFKIYRLIPREESLLAAKGKMTTVYAHFHKQSGRMESRPIPKSLADRIHPPA